MSDRKVQIVNKINAYNHRLSFREFFCKNFKGQRRLNLTEGSCQMLNGLKSNADRLLVN